MGFRSGARELPKRPSGGESTGYAMVDSLISLLIISTSIVFSLQALGASSRSADALTEARRARALLDRLVTETGQVSPLQEGRSGGFAWQAAQNSAGGERPIEICARIVELVNEASQRRYRASTLVTCPAVVTP